MYSKACCDDCAGGGLGALPSFSIGGPSFGLPSFGSGFGFNTGGGFGSGPFTGSLEYSLERKWYDPILDVVGDIGGEALQIVKDLIKRRVGEEVWERMPQESKEAAISRAWDDVKAGRVQVGGLSPTLLIVGGVLLYLLLKR